MAREILGGFELMVLLALIDSATTHTGLASRRRSKLAGPHVAIGSLYLTLKRLEQKRLVIFAARRADRGTWRPRKNTLPCHGKRSQGRGARATDLDDAVEWRSPASGRTRMTARAPRVATWLLIRFSSGPHGEAIAGDLVEQSAARSSRLWYWRQVLSAIHADIDSTVRDNRWRTAAAIALGWTHMRLRRFRRRG